MVWFQFKRGFEGLTYLRDLLFRIRAVSMQSHVHQEELGVSGKAAIRDILRIVLDGQVCQMHGLGKVLLKHTRIPKRHVEHRSGKFAAGEAGDLLPLSFSQAKVWPAGSVNPADPCSGLFEHRLDRPPR